jgi:hypothetical protein
MPAFFAYLFSIAVFVGGGYAGLVWLTSPPPCGNKGNSEQFIHRANASKGEPTAYGRRRWAIGSKLQGGLPNG